MPTLRQLSRECAAGRWATARPTGAAVRSVKARQANEQPLRQLLVLKEVKRYHSPFGVVNVTKLNTVLARLSEYVLQWKSERPARDQAHHTATSRNFVR